MSFLGVWAQDTVHGPNFTVEGPTAASMGATSPGAAQQGSSAPHPLWGLSCRLTCCTGLGASWGPRCFASLQQGHGLAPGVLWKTPWSKVWGGLFGVLVAWLEAPMALAPPSGT